MNQEYECPINNIKLFMPGENPPANYESVPLNNGVTLGYTSEGSQMAIANLRLTESEVCMNKDEFGSTIGRVPYTLYEETECHYSIAGKHTDPRYEVVGSVREDFLFVENGLQSLMESLPMFDLGESARYEWKLS